MGKVFDEADYRRRMDALETSNISIGQEVGDIGSGWAGLLNPFVGSTGRIADGPLNARKDILLAKQRALRQARKQMIRAIREEDERARASHVLPLEVEEIVTGSSDQLVKVG